MRKRATNEKTPERAGTAAKQQISHMAQDVPNPRLNPAAMSLRDAARLLAKVGGPSISEAMLTSDVDAGAPTNADGTINLVHYAAWLVREMGRSAGDRHGE